MGAEASVPEIPDRLFTVEEYRELERTTQIKYEYHAGKVVAQAGGTVSHGRLCSRINGELVFALREKQASCEVLNSETSLHVAHAERFVYPDSMVICGDLELAEGDANHAVTNPIVIVEVLSSSTAHYDRGEKFMMYRQIPSLREYVLIEQDNALVEMYYRVPDQDLWRITEAEGLDQSIRLESLDIAIEMERLYRGIL
ncbi:MAG TPA: Uma2 family endonuclease [Cytophagales bacterium]|nr:Uma2 family endonuclease [Cytophagales bacterium]HAA18218.1 Uma2 family endonuclease [Cytophagales bacterium]HAP59234.1 Uma2 family endonuclease [Cytophagales bacterium]